MALDRTAIENAIVGVVRLGGGFASGHVIIANQDKPRPAEPYASVNAGVATGRYGMFDEERTTDTPGEILKVGHRRLTVSIHVYATNAVAIAERIAEYLESTAATEALEDLGLAFLEAQPARDMAAMLETRNQGHAQLDTFFGAVSSRTEQVGWIETVSLDGELAADAASDPLSITLTIP